VVWGIRGTSGGEACVATELSLAGEMSVATDSLHRLKCVPFSDKSPTDGTQVPFAWCQIELYY
jgi:hypothetical protein